MNCAVIDQEWEHEGLIALKPPERDDKTSHQINQQTLHQLILKTYREGNKGFYVIIVAN